jgi:hypothetical protein
MELDRHTLPVEGFCCGPCIAEGIHGFISYSDANEEFLINLRRACVVLQHLPCCARRYVIRPCQLGNDYCFSDQVTDDNHANEHNTLRDGIAYRTTAQSIASEEYGALQVGRSQAAL